MLFWFSGVKQMAGTSQEAVPLNKVSVACSLGFIELPARREWVLDTPVLDKRSFEDRLLITRVFT